MRKPQGTRSFEKDRYPKASGLTALEHLHLQNLGNPDQQPQLYRSTGVEDNSIAHPSREIKTKIESLLVIDPDPDFSSTVSDYLTLFGYQVSHCNSLVSAMDFVQKSTCDLIFLSDNFDQSHPINSLRQLKKSTNSRIIVLATRGDDQLAVELIKAGASDYLSRRVKDKDILTSLASLLERVSQQHSSLLQGQTNATSETSEPIKQDDKLGERLVKFYEGASSKAGYDKDISELESETVALGDDHKPSLESISFSNESEFDLRELTQPSFEEPQSATLEFENSAYKQPEYDRSDISPSLNQREFSRQELEEQKTNHREFGKPNYFPENHAHQKHAPHIDDIQNDERRNAELRDRVHLDKERHELEINELRRDELARNRRGGNSLGRQPNDPIEIDRNRKEKASIFERLAVAPESEPHKTPYQKNKTNENLWPQIANISDLPGNLISLEQNLNIDVINHSASNLLGFSVQKNLQKSVLDFIPQLLHKAFQSELESVSENCHVINSHVPGNQKIFETVLKIKNGKTIPVNCHLSCYESKASNGKISSLRSGNLNTQKQIRYLLSFDDISEVKSAQAKQQFQAMWNNILHNYSYRFINFKLADFSTEISSIISETASFFKLDRVSIFLLNKSANNAKIYLEWLKSDYLSLKQFSKKIDMQDDAIEFSKLKNGEVQLLEPEKLIRNAEDLSCFGLSEHYAQVGTQSSVIIPLEKHSETASKNIIGWLSLDYQSTINHWDIEDLELLAPLGKLISEAFSRRAQEEHRRVTHQKLSENHGRLSEQAFTDGLTNLANRRYFDKVLESEVRRASRDGSNLAVLFCDVDYFKAYNDTYGHLEGDVCLRAIAKVLKLEFQRASDFVARFGGEEFAIILSGMTLEDSRDAAEKLIRKIIEQNILHHGSPIGQISISIGIASVIAPSPGDANKILSKADKALYKAKSNGRNRVEVVSYSPN